jgi:hypothetical protein
MDHQLSKLVRGDLVTLARNGNHQRQTVPEKTIDAGYTDRRKAAEFQNK